VTVDNSRFRLSWTDQAKAAATASDTQVPLPGRDLGVQPAKLRRLEPQRHNRVRVIVRPVGQRDDDRRRGRHFGDNRWAIRRPSINLTFQSQMLRRNSAHNLFDAGFAPGYFKQSSLPALNQTLGDGLLVDLIGGPPLGDEPAKFATE